MVEAPSKAEEEHPMALQLMLFCGEPDVRASFVGLRHRTERPVERLRSPPVESHEVDRETLWKPFGTARLIWLDWRRGTEVPVAAANLKN